MLNSTLKSLLPGNTLTLRPADRTPGSPGNTLTVTPSVSEYISIRDVNKHFLTIAFSEYNGGILRQEQGRPLTVSLFGNYSLEDENFLEKFLADFNRVSMTENFFTNVKHGEEADLWINILPESALKDMPATLKSGKNLSVYCEYEDLVSDRINYIVDFSGNQVYINSDLPAKERRHYTLRAVAFWLGITGEATDTDSFFYPGNTGQDTFSRPDWRAWKILYGPVVKKGLTLSETKNRLYVG